MALRMDTPRAKHVSKFPGNPHITSPGGFLSGSHSIIPFSGNYYVPDLVDWGQFFLSLAMRSEDSKRKANRKDIVHNTRMGWQDEEAGFHAEPIFRCKCLQRENSGGAGCLGAAAESLLVL